MSLTHIIDKVMRIHFIENSNEMNFLWIFFLKTVDLYTFLG